MKNNHSPQVTISVKVTEESSNGWKSFCDANGITLSAFIEVAGRQLATETHPPSVPERMHMVEMARDIDRQRRTRKKKKT